MFAAMRARVDYWRSNLNAEMERLAATISRFDPLDDLAIGFARYALKDPETYEEPQHASVMPLEHVATVIAKNAGNALQEPIDENDGAQVAQASRGPVKPGRHRTCK